MLDQSVPRITVWKGHLIKYFSNLDLKKKKRFGKRQLKKNLAHCYSEFGLIGDCKSGNEAATANHPSFFTVGFKQSLNMMFGSKLEDRSSVALSIPLSLFKWEIFVILRSSKWLSPMFSVESAWCPHVWFW